ncbi:MAG: aminotransferase class III-fold pyridoxal phosphate-dependent enzyme, partial [Steroidobacteraceae bacterium]
IFARADAIGTRLRGRLEALAQRQPDIAEVRGLGAMVAFELCRNGDPDAPDAELTKALVTRARELGLILLSCGSYANVIRILVPLTAADALIDEGLDILTRAFDELRPAGRTA